MFDFFIDPLIPIFPDDTDAGKACSACGEKENDVYSEDLETTGVEVESEKTVERIVLHH